MDEKNKPTDVTSKKFKVNLKRKRNYNKKMIIGGVASIVLVVVGGIYTLSTQSSTTPQQAQSETTDDAPQQLASALGLVEGTVQYSADAEAWKDAAGGETVPESYFVRTLNESRAVVLFDDGSALRLDANTTVQLETIDSDQTNVLLEDGQVYSRVVKSQNRTYAVATDRERFEALGTAYKTATDETKDTVEVYESTVKVDSQDTEVEEGNTYDTQSKQANAIDLAKLGEDEFVQWNKQKDSENEDFKSALGVLEKEVTKEEPETEPTNDSSSSSTPAAPASISLSGTATDDGVKLNWVLSNTQSTDGFKVVRAHSDSTPTYKENTSVYVSGGSSRSSVINVKDGKTYYFRVCIYRAASGSCDTYSNTIQVQAPDNPVEAVKNGTVSLSITDATLNWTFTGTAPHGFKVVLNTSGNPSYPANSIQYLGAGTTSYTLPDKPAGSYYVKVCKYTASDVDGGCTDYSNQVEYIVTE